MFVGIGLNLVRGGGSASPASLFAAGEPGVWYDPSDLTTLFTDSAGNTPVTAPGQTVGLMLDKSKSLAVGANVWPGGFSTSGWTTSLTVLTNDGSGYLVATFAGTNSYMFKSVSCLQNTAYVLNLAISGAGLNYIISTSGVSGNIAFAANVSGPTVRIQFNSGANTSISIGLSKFSGAGVSTISAIEVKSLAGNHATQGTSGQRPTYGINPITGTRNLLLATDTMATQSRTVTNVAHTLSFTGTGTVTLTGASIAGPLIGTGAGNRVSLTFTPTAASLTMTVTGSVTFAQLELGSTATAYQKVVTQYEVTEAGVQSVSYISFDGTDDNMITPIVTPNTDKMQIFSGVRKLSDAITGIIAEMVVGTDLGRFSLACASASGANSYRYISKGTATANAGTGVFAAAPDTAVLTGIGEISADIATLRRNGVLVQTDTIDQGTGNYLAYPINIGSRSTTSLFLNGRLYSLIVRFGANLTAGQITSTESWVNGKTGAY